MQKKLKVLLTSIINWLAHKTIAKFKPVVIGVTGSVGKTSTKEAIFAILEKKKRARCNVGNFNSEYGVPLTVLGDWTEKELEVISRDVTNPPTAGQKVLFFSRIIITSSFRLAFGWKKLYPEVLVLEYAADKSGDLSYLTKIVKPNISVVTAVGDIPVHVEFYPTAEAVAKEKAHLVEALPASGLAVLSGDELRVSVMAQKTRATSLTFGFAENCDVRIIDFENKIENKDGILKPTGIVFKLGYDGAFVPVRINGTLGYSQAYSAAAAACVGLAFNLNLVDVSEALAYYKPPHSRMQFLPGINKSTIIDDSYNASPLSLRLAIETVKEIKAARKIAIIGDMLELGSFSVPAHKEIGALAAKIFDVIIAVGPQAKYYADAASKARIAKKNCMYVENVSALQNIGEFIKPGDLVLVKASHGIHLSKAVSALRAQ